MTSDVLISMVLFREKALDRKTVPYQLRKIWPLSFCMMVKFPGYEEMAAQRGNFWPSLPWKLSDGVPAGFHVPDSRSCHLGVAQGAVRKSGCCVRAFVPILLVVLTATQ